MELNSGTKTITVAPGSRCHFSSTKEATIYGTLDGKRTGILGPPFKESRIWSFILPLEYDGVNVKTPQATVWTFNFVPPDRKETPDLTPLETTVERPLTLREEMKRFISTELSRVAESSEMETEAEANDFEMDEDDEFHSPYEINEMVEEPHPDAPVEPPTEENPPPPTQETLPVDPPGPDSAPDPTDPSKGHIPPPVAPP